MIKFNVFSRTMSVLKINNEWQLFNEPDIGICSRVYDVVIPAELIQQSEDELLIYLDDIYHELATEKHPSAMRQ